MKLSMIKKMGLANFNLLFEPIQEAFEFSELHLAHNWCLIMYHLIPNPKSKLTHRLFPLT